MSETEIRIQALKLAMEFYTRGDISNDDIIACAKKFYGFISEGIPIDKIKPF